MVTRDGIATQIGEDQTMHPVYKTLSYALRAELVLSAEEAILYRELHNQKTGVVRLHIRSALAQLGVDAFHPAVTDVILKGNILVIDTLITSFNEQSGEQVIQCMRKLMKEGQSPRIMHAGLFPHETRVMSAVAVLDLVAHGSLQIDGADVHHDGSIGLVPSAPLYVFHDAAISDESLATILLGDGRATLASLRDEHNALPLHMKSKDFIVTGVDVHTTDHHVVLRRETLAQGIPTSVVHGESCILQAGRTRGGTRQLELWNANGKTETVSQLRIVADLYRSATIAEPGH